jgi:hypothetical protein
MQAIAGIIIVQQPILFSVTKCQLDEVKSSNHFTSADTLPDEACFQEIKVSVVFIHLCTAGTL